MDLRLGSKRIKAIYKGDTPIPGLMVNDRLWHGSAGTIILSSGGSAAEVDKVYYSKTISDGETVLVSSGGKMYDPAVSCGGVLSVYAGGSALSVMEKGGYVMWDHAASVTCTPGEFGGIEHMSQRATVHAGTTATDITLDSDGELHILSGGTVSNIIVNQGGKITGGYAYLYGITENGGGVVISSYFDMSFNSNSFSNMIITDSATIHSCTTANSLTIANNGYIGVHVSGRLSNTTVESGGVACILVDGVANTITISSGGSMIVSYGGSALNVTSMTGAEITVDSGGYITYA